MKQIIVNIATLIITLLCTGYSSFSQQNLPTADKQVAPPLVAASNIHTGANYAGTTINYIRTWQPNKKIQEEAEVMDNDRRVQEVAHTTQYFDGLGRPVQTVAWQAAPGKKDMVLPVEYDEFGREVYKYLPYASTDNTGSFKSDPFTQQSSFYTTAYAAQQRALIGETVFYGKTQYEASPLNRVEKTFAPGNNWAGSEGMADEHSVSIQYLFNDETDDVQIWSIRFDDLTYQDDDITTNIPSVSGVYRNGQLYKTITIDEQKNEVIEYKDKEGHVVLKKVQAGDITGGDPYTGWLLTYYVYDNLGQLRFVMPPKAIAGLKENGWRFTDDDIISELCFRYEYDERQRITAKKVPGAGWVYMVYDNRDRLVFTQDVNMRSKNQWMYTLYDVLNRPVETGITLLNWHPDEMQASQKQFEEGEHEPTYRESVTGNAVGGSSFANIVIVCNNFICGNPDNIPLSLMYYDDYSQTEKAYIPDFATKVNSSGQYMDDPYIYPDYLPGEPSRLTTGMTTVTRVKVLADGNDLRRSKWLETVSYYDDKGRTVQVNSDNYGQGTDIVTSLSDFTGKALSTYDVHTNYLSDRKPRTSVLTTMRYDEGGRLQEVHKEVDGDLQSDRLIASYGYDAMGQILTKKLGQKRNTDIADGLLTTQPLEALGYSYNIRGWLKGINWNYGTPPPETPRAGYSSVANPHWFSMDLSYDWGYAHNQYNGNIAGMRWQSRGDGVKRSYGYGYDEANRLLFADFTQTSGRGDAPHWNKQDPDDSGLEMDFSMMMEMMAQAVEMPTMKMAI